jgi:hypothetical protein
MVVSARSYPVLRGRRLLLAIRSAIDQEIQPLTLGSSGFS